MKKTFAIILAALLPALAWGQAQINTKKMKIADFTQKITKVVLTGNEFFDMALQNEITMGWRISPYEFCTMEEFEEYRTSDEFYFLVSVNGKFRKDNIPTISYLTLVKGGQGAEGGIHACRFGPVPFRKRVRIPSCASGDNPELYPGLNGE